MHLAGKLTVHMLSAGVEGPAVSHGSRVKVRLTLHDGAAVDRIPAWVRRATVPWGQMGAKFDGVHWDPPAHERHQWWVCFVFCVAQ